MNRVPVGRRVPVAEYPLPRRRVPGGEVLELHDPRGHTARDICPEVCSRHTRRFHLVKEYCQEPALAPVTEGRRIGIDCREVDRTGKSGYICSSASVGCNRVRDVKPVSAKIGEVIWSCLEGCELCHERVVGASAKDFLVGIDHRQVPGACRPRDIDRSCAVDRDSPAFVISRPPEIGRIFKRSAVRGDPAHECVHDPSAGRLESGHGGIIQGPCKPCYIRRSLFIHCNRSPCILAFPPDICRIYKRFP